MMFPSPSSGITLGESFTPLKDLASLTEFRNDSVSDESEQLTLLADETHQIKAFSGQAESVNQDVSCSFIETKCSQIVDGEKTEVKREDPTQKASDMLIKTLLEEQKRHAGKKVSKKSDPMSIRFQRKPVAKKRKSKTEKPAIIAAKKAKIVKPNESQAKSQRTKKSQDNNFGSLRMVQLKQYEIPTNVSNIEKKIDGSYLPIVKQMIEASVSDSKLYTPAYAALLFLTETAESISLQGFDQEDIHISYSRVGRTFQITNTVNRI